MPSVQGSDKKRNLINYRSLNKFRYHDGNPLEHQ